jgi:hypothetical protein
MAKVIMRITKIIPKRGIKMAKILNPAAPSISKMEKAGFAKPPVIVEDNPRNAVVEAWMIPAAPPPAMIANAQRRKGE